jgi:uridylate kinase
MSAIPMLGVVDSYHRRKAITHLRTGHVVIFAAGTGNPFFTTDTAACLRGIEVDVDVVLKATKVDGVYSADPVLHPEAERYESLSYDEVLAKNLAVMDSTAICLCREHNMPLVIFDMGQENAIKEIVQGEKIGTKIGG